jgi:hypothetical protein
MNRVRARADIAEVPMAWSGLPTTLVSQLTLTEWKFSLRPGRELLTGYTLRSYGAWHVFGDDRWVWFNGVITGSEGAVEIVSQWAEALVTGDFEGDSVTVNTWDQRFSEVPEPGTLALLASGAIAAAVRARGHRRRVAASSRPAPGVTSRSLT